MKSEGELVGKSKVTRSLGDSSQVISGHEGVMEENSGNAVGVLAFGGRSGSAKFGSL